MNASGIDVPPGATALDAVRAWDASAAADVEGGRRLITDSRGLPLDATATMSAGSIIRLVAKRDRGAAEDRAE
ncbi:MAG TPA: hypothetical protein VGP95_19385 [Gemmatimonadaceae bacterium]|nr:hypothetical protein [Gemmatimonadaceae bacterium]